MRRRGKAGGQTIKTQRRKTLRRNAAKAARRRSSPTTAKETSGAQAIRERDDALEQLTATAEVLTVMSRSAFELQTVFDALVKSATRLCHASASVIWRPKDDGRYHLAASYGLEPRFEEHLKSLALKPDGRSVVGRSLQSGKTTYVSDLMADTDYAGRDASDFGGYRGLLCVPLLRDGVAIGVLMVAHLTSSKFSEKQITLVNSFAKQAVIAIENTRLLNELRESLQQQTATADVLKVISSSPGNLEPVFQAMLANAVHICDAKFGTLFRCDGDLFQFAAEVGTPAKLADFERGRGPFQPPSGTLVERVRQTKQVQHTADYSAEPVPGASARLGGARSAVCIPMLKDGVLVGVFLIYRQEVRPFTDKQIELLTNFAAQAVIAIENARLLSELRQRTDDLSESLEQQTATSEVLKVISSSPTNVQPVFDSIAESAVRLCNGQFSFVVRFDGKAMEFASYFGLSAEGLDAFRRLLPLPAREDTAAGRALLRRAVVQVPDVEADPAYGTQARGLAKTVIYRSIVAVPLLHEGNPVGAIAVARADAGFLPNRQIVLLRAFADQAVIAIENVRLFDEVQTRTRELAKSLEDLRATQDRLVQTQKLASLGQLTAGIAHEIKNPLNFVNNFSGVSAELVDELQEVLKDPSLAEKRRDEIAELMDTLRSNLDKVVQHGKRADAIVKNMLLHSHQGSGEHRPVAINAIVEESLKLAYHGARAEKQNFNVMVEQSFDPVAGEADIFPQEITRVLLNLISNGVYATRNKTLSDGEIYKPILTASTKNLGDRVEIRIRDNGTGIPSDVKEKIFNPFFTTKPAGEGTGLGLSISHDIIVKQHGGSIEVDTRPGEFTEVRIVLPRTAAAISG